MLRLLAPRGVPCALRRTTGVRAFSTGLRTSTGVVPNSDDHKKDGTNKHYKTLDVWDTLARMVGPRPDTVTTDNLRSSRTESLTRPFNPGSPVDSEGNPLTPEVPQYYGDNRGADASYKALFDVKYYPRDTRVQISTTAAQRVALLEGGEAAPAVASSGLPPRPPSFGLSTPNGRSPTNGPVHGS